MPDGATAPDLITHDGCATMGALFAKRCRESADQIAHREKNLGVWRSYTWADYWNHARWTGLGLMELGVGRGDVASNIRLRRMNTRPLVVFHQ